MKSRRVQNIDLSGRDIKRDLFYSVVSSFIFGTISAVGFYPHRSSLWNFQLDVALWVVAAQVVVLIVVHDAYFYWSHRLLHKTLFFNKIHRLHHLSTNPSPFSALSFHPVEAFIEAIWFLPMIFLFNFSFLSWAIFAYVVLIINVVGHMSIEIYPDGWKTHPVMKWVNRTTYHNQHHQYYNGNYGLYFTFWDRLMGTFIKSPPHSKSV